jgi:hypothetical protein
MSDTRIIDAKLLSVLWGIDRAHAATLLARACERGEIYGREFYGGIKYEVSIQWLEENHASV